ncbi:MAG: restriction endonuclease subunit S, partial [Lachnospiraceae bacterium]|nr:restriction endonuclease subunit S [Lachnospiraceae bacterium]
LFEEGQVEWVKTSTVKKASFWLMPATPKFQDQGIPYITSKNIKNGMIDFDDVKYISENDT